MMVLSCRACADACRRCGQECESFDTDLDMKICLDACQRCEESCRNMVKAMEADAGGATKAPAERHDARPARPLHASVNRKHQTSRGGPIEWRKQVPSVRPTITERCLLPRLWDVAVFVGLLPGASREALRRFRRKRWRCGRILGSCVPDGDFSSTGFMMPAVAGWADRADFGGLAAQRA